ncbi:M15 family metallopeptidase [Microbacterium sediminis]|uniref:M15 family metallopeptidase n=1 Tax=Microbacterium sediminis TaxID=904291 RepID=UPI001071DC47|nr:M15 family metallopeptidase [Microbacterium sediminis]QBR74326.1 peptidase M15 [Microbacterium sediminis]
MIITRTRALAALALVTLAAALTACASTASDTSGAADGVLPDGATLYEDLPGITGLDPDLLAALRQAADDAAADGIEFVVNSGWRSEALQQQLMDDAIAEHGSWEAASRWVATAHGSAHTTGDAVDIGGWDAAEWLQHHGARYDLCQIFDNEAWHFELRPGAATNGCPRMYVLRPGRQRTRWQRGQKWLERFVKATRTIARPQRGHGWPARP